jgi:alpha-galactosidase
VSRRQGDGWTRRRLLTGVLVGAPAIAAACAPPPPPTPPPTPTGAPRATATLPPPATATPRPTPTPVPLAAPLSGGRVTPTDRAALTTWLSGKFGPRATSPPFSFQYGDQSSAAQLTGWTVTDDGASVAHPGRSQQRSTYVDPRTRLEVQVDVTTFADYPAVEWVLGIRNASTVDSAVLSDLHALDLTVPVAASAEVGLHYARGSTAQASDFKAVDRRLAAGDQVRLTPSGGRSSDGVLPFFNVELPDGLGVIAAVGWSGQWQVLLERDSTDGRLRMRAGLERLRTLLHPGEAIRSPRILLVFWTGERAHGQNLLRRLLLEHYTPRRGSQAIVGPIWASSTGDLGFNNTSEANQLASIEAVVQNRLPVEYWQMDAGWFVNGWPVTGTWSPDPKRFPSGLKPVGDAAHQHGMGYILWFEPERVMPDTELARIHPEWLLAPVDLPSELDYQRPWRLLDLGHPDALEWATATFSGLIGAYGVDIYRHDFNMHPLYYWRAQEPADRQGMTELRYILGFYAFWDRLRADHPDLVIDNSASGGRRLDLETISRSIALFRTDYFWVAEADQDMTYSLAAWLPIHAQGVHEATDAYTFRSGLGTSVCLAFDFTRPRAWDGLRALLEEYRSIREYLYGDFYPLLSGIVGTSLWTAYQFDRPDLGGGFALAFHREGGGHATLPVRLRGLDPTAQYEVTIANTAPVRTISGADLATSGVEAAADGPRQSILITYRRQPA